ncbi:MAG: ParA family protein [Pseudobdellovibrionaceae bacterium]
MIQMQDLAQSLNLGKIDIQRQLAALGLPKKVYEKNTIAPGLVRQLVFQQGRTYPQKVISFQMLKGGVAKTTSAFLLGTRLADYGAKVLFVDLDQQANLTSALGFQNVEAPVWIDLIEGKVQIESAVQTLKENIDLIPSSLDNSVIDRVLMKTTRNWSMCVKGPLSRIQKKYDFIIIDLAPALSIINTASTIASDTVILPVNPDRFSFIGLEKHLEEIAETESEFGQTLEKKILFTKFDSREKLSQSYLQLLIEKYPQFLFDNYIRTSSEIKNCLENQKDLFSFKNPLREDFDLLTLEVLGWNSNTLSATTEANGGIDA